MRLIGFSILLAIGGTTLGALWTFVIGIGGALGALLTTARMKAADSQMIPTWGLLLTVAGQLYMSLIFVGFVVLTTKGHLAGESGLGRWIAWFVAFGVALVPSMSAMSDSAGQQNRNVQHQASPFTAMLSLIGFFVFVFAPSVQSTLWGWVPSF